MNTIKLLFVGTRPKTLLICVSPFILGSAFAFNVNRYINIPLNVLTLTLFLSLQIFANYSNDYFDYINGKDSEKREGPLKITHSNKLPFYTMQHILMLLVWFILILTLIIIHFSQQNELLLLTTTVLAILSAWLYTGGPLPLGYIGLGEILVFVSFGPLSVLTSYYIQIENSYLNLETLVVSISCGLIAASILVINNIRDKVSDRITQKNTSSVLFGKSFGQIEYVTTLLSGCLSSFILITKDSHNLPLLASLCAILIRAFKLSRSVFLTSNADDYNSLLANTSQFLLMYSCLIGFSCGGR
uniref:Menaquinone biosynthesis protein n=1 Tax=Gronococcus sybilensis TaxID=3028029 RepID=A0A9Y1I2D7_9RHOD|nr:menaquinone biosynthesis protein [Gronococcus sybilensis]